MDVIAVAVGVLALGAVMVLAEAGRRIVAGARQEHEWDRMRPQFPMTVHHVRVFAPTAANAAVRTSSTHGIPTAS